MSIIISVLRPVLVDLLLSPGARKLLVEVLEKLAKKTDNEVDDLLVAGLRRALKIED